MIDIEATPRADLERQIMDPNIPKNEREWWAAAEIERLQADNAHLTALLKGLFDYCNDDRRTPKIQSLLEATEAVLALLAEESKP